MRDWRWWHIALAWLAGLVVGMALWASSVKTTYLSGEDGAVYAIHLSQRVVLLWLAILGVLCLLTIFWWRGRAR